MMENPFVSIVIPACNEGKTIGACLDSLARQNYPKDKYEIIVVDNNSTDNTAEVARSFNTTVVEEKRQGLVFSRRRGIAVSQGGIIAFLDADSLAQPLWLKKMVEIYQQDERVVGIGQNLNLIPKTPFVALGEAFSNLGRSVLKILPGTHFSFRKDAYDKTGGYSSKANFGEDIYLSKKLKKFGRLVIQPKGLVTSSSRRLLSIKDALPYLFKTLLSLLTISLFDISFFKLKPMNLQG